MTAEMIRTPGSVWEVRYSYRPAGKTWRSNGKTLVLCGTIERAIQLIADATAALDEFAIDQILKRTSDVILVDPNLLMEGET